MTEEINDQDEGKVELSPYALAALRDFYNEQDQQKQRFEELKAATETSDLATRLSMDMFAEDWNASQFWYCDDTALALAKELLLDAGSDQHIAIISAPSVFVQLKNLLSDESGTSHKPQICLLEFDERFRVMPEFHHYDFQQPLKLDPNMKGQYDCILCDPPFLSEDCQTKTAMTVRWLSKKADPTKSAPKSKIIICTGERMEGLIHRLYTGIKTTTFEPRHAQDRLSNAFRCYANYENSIWSFQ